MIPNENPVSYLVLGTLPEYKFNVQSSPYFDSWKDKAIKCVLDSFFDFLINGTLSIKLIEDEKRIFFNKLLLGLASFEIHVNEKCENTETSWLENKIRKVFSKNDVIQLDDFIQDLFVSLFFESNKQERVLFINPYKQFMARLIEEGVSHKIWSCKVTRLNTKLFNDSRIRKVEMIIDESNIKRINYQSRLFYAQKCEFIEKYNLYLLEKTLTKLIDKEFLKYMDID